MALSKAELRMRRIGGSSAASALGLSRYERPENLRRRISFAMHGIEAIKRYMPKVSPEGNVITEADWQAEEIRLNQGIDSIHIRVGVFLEDFVCARLKKSGINIRRKNQLMVHPDIDYVTANLDGHESDAVEEIKCISIYRMKEFGDEYTDDVPMDYACQGHHYMLFPQFKHARLRCLFLSPSEKELVDRMIRSHILKYVAQSGIQLTDTPVEITVPRYGTVYMTLKKAEEYIEGNSEEGGGPVCSMNLDVIQNLVDIAPLKSYSLDYDEEIAEHQLSEYKDLWHRATNMIPCVPRTVEDCQLMYNGASTDKTMIASDAVKRLTAERAEIAARMKVDKIKLEKIMDTLMIESGDADTITGAGGIILFKIGRTWSKSKDENMLAELVGKDISKYYKTGIIDWKAVEAGLPEVYQKCRYKTERSIKWPRGKGKKK